MNKLPRLLICLAFIFCGSTFISGQVSFYREKHLCSARNVKEKLVFNAVNGNSEALLNKFLKNGGNPNVTDDCGISIIFYAIQPVGLEMLKILVKAGADVNVQDNRHGDAPLLVLIRLLDTFNDRYSDEIYDAVKFLIENGANVNLQTKYGNSALIEAVKIHQSRLVQLLLTSGAEVNYQDNANMTAYSYAAQLGDKDLKQILIQAGANINIGVQDYQKDYGESAFFQAAADGRTDIVEAMITSGTDVNSANKAGKMTALMRATEDSTVDSLLAAGANVNLKDNSGHTALHWAILFRLSSIVQKLITAGADINTRNNKGESALDLVVDDRTREILIKAGAK